jgi:hypothetical protein
MNLWGVSFVLVALAGLVAFVALAVGSCLLVAGGGRKR